MLLGGVLRARLPARLPVLPLSARVLPGLGVPSRSLHAVGDPLWGLPLLHVLLLVPLLPQKLALVAKAWHTPGGTLGTASEPWPGPLLEVPGRLGVHRHVCEQILRMGLAAWQGWGCRPASTCSRRQRVPVWEKTAVYCIAVRCGAAESAWVTTRQDLHRHMWVE